MIYTCSVIVWFMTVLSTVIGTGLMIMMFLLIHFFVQGFWVWCFYELWLLKLIDKWCDQYMDTVVWWDSRVNAQIFVTIRFIEFLLNIKSKNFAYGCFVTWSVDILSCGHFNLLKFWLVDILSRGRFDGWTFYRVDILSVDVLLINILPRGHYVVEHFVVWKFWGENILTCERFDGWTFYRVDIFPAEVLLVIFCRVDFMSDPLSLKILSWSCFFTIK